MSVSPPHSVFAPIVIVFLLFFARPLLAQTCDNIPDPGTEGISAKLTVSSTTTPVTGAIRALPTLLSEFPWLVPVTP